MLPESFTALCTFRADLDGKLPHLFLIIGALKSVFAVLKLIAAHLQFNNNRIGWQAVQDLVGEYVVARTRITHNANIRENFIRPSSIGLSKKVFWR